MTVLSRIILGDTLQASDYRSWIYSSGVKTAWTSYSDKTINDINKNDALLASDKFMVVGNNGQVAYSDNFNTWTNLTSNLTSTGWGTANIFKIFSIASSHFIIFGQGGKIATTSNNGVTWTYINTLFSSSEWDAGSSYNNDIVSIAQIDNDPGNIKILIAGRRGQIARATLPNFSDLVVFSQLKNSGHFSTNELNFIDYYHNPSGSIAAGNYSRYVVGGDNRILGTANIGDPDSWTISILPGGSNIDSLQYGTQYSETSQSVVPSPTYCIYGNKSNTWTLTKNFIDFYYVPTGLSAGKGITASYVDYGYRKEYLLASNINDTKAITYGLLATAMPTNPRAQADPGINFINDWPTTSNVTCMHYGYSDILEYTPTLTSIQTRTLLVGGSSGEVAKHILYQEIS